MKIHFYGVGAALNETMDNTHFLIEDGDSRLQVDCGGGLSLAQRIKRRDTDFSNIFITHKHTDHILGFFALVRMMKRGYLENLNVFCSKDSANTIKSVIETLEINTGKKAISENRLIFNILEDKVNLNINNFKLKPLNLQSNKMEQFGFLLESNGKKILFFGDEAVGVLDRNDLDEFKGVDYLICEALNTFDMSKEGGGITDNKKICHITAMEAGKIASKIDAKNLVLVHTQENLNGDRQEVLINDAAREFNGNIIVPNEGDILDF